MKKKVNAARTGSVALRVVLVFLMSAVQKLTGGLDVARDHLNIAPWFWVVTVLFLQSRTCPTPRWLLAARSDRGNGLHGKNDERPPADSQTAVNARRP
jgi:hypothetical protein